MFALQAGGQIMQHEAQGAGVRSRNRAKLKNFEEQNRQYNREVMLNNNEWKNEVQIQDIEQDQVYQAMISQWSEQDQQLDKIFAQGDQKVEKAIVEMYENEYAGTQTGRTAGRLAGKGAKKLGQYKSEVLHNMMMAKDETALRGEMTHQDAAGKSRGIYEKIRFSPIHGHTPVAPELEAKPGMGGLILGLALSGLGAAKAGGMFKAPDVGSGTASSLTKGAEWGSVGDYTGIGDAGANISGGALSPGPSFGAGMGWESVASPNMDWGGMGSAPWDTGSSSSGFGNFGSDIGANLDQNFFSSK